MEKLFLHIQGSKTLDSIQQKFIYKKNMHFNFLTNVAGFWSFWIRHVDLWEFNATRCLTTTTCKSSSALALRPKASWVMTADPISWTFSGLSHLTSTSSSQTQRMLGRFQKNAGSLVIHNIILTAWPAWDRSCWRPSPSTGEEEEFWFFDRTQN